MLEEYISHIDSVGAVAAGLSPWLRLPNEECYAILAEDSVARRTEMLEKVLYDYLDFVTSLSWEKGEAEHIALDEARRILDEDHYGLDKVKKRIIQQIAVMNLKNFPGKAKVRRTH